MVWYKFLNGTLILTSLKMMAVIEYICKSEGSLRTRISDLKLSFAMQGYIVMKALDLVWPVRPKLDKFYS